MKKTLLTQEALAALLTPEAEAPVITEEPVVPEVVAEEAPVETVLKSELDTVQAEFATFKAASETLAKELTDKVTVAEALHTEAITASADLKDIVISQISRMRLGLKVAAVDMSSWSVKAVVEELNSTSESFIKALPVGSVIPKEATKKAEVAVASSVDASAIKSLGF